MAIYMKSLLLMVLLQVVYFSTAESCRDEASTCSKYVARGYCISSNKYAGLMKEICCASCSVCDNKHSACDRFAQKGYCTYRYTKWMKQNCCLACKKKAAGGSSGSGSGSSGSGSSSSGSGASSTKSSLDPAACTKSLNGYRNRHVNTPAMKWDAGLASKAQAYAEHLKKLSLAAGRVVMKHDPNNQKDNTGENLYMRDNREIGDCKDADKAWYSEISDWDFTHAKSKGGATGHFTQMVWVGTTRFGVGRVTFDSPKFKKYGNKVTIIVGKYQKPGNIAMRGQRFEWYSRNVQPLKN